MICYLKMRGKRVPIKVPDVDSLPKMMRCAAIAELIGIRCNSMEPLCNRLGVPIARAGNGARKIKLISPKLFFERIQEAEANEAIQSHV
jgi:hypothetical protein